MSAVAVGPVNSARVRAAETLAELASYTGVNSANPSPLGTLAELARPL